jgi:AcrR family transcriptional regulator
MSKAETIDALMESAIHCFSQHGYEGAALRDIAAEAGVPLSTIHMYFGSKAELYTAIERKAWIECEQGSPTFQEIEWMQRTEEAIVVARGAAREGGCEGNSPSLRSCRQLRGQQRRATLRSRSTNSLESMSCMSVIPALVPHRQSVEDVTV